MKTLLTIRDEAAKMKGYRVGQNAAEFFKANPEGAKHIAELMKANMPALVKELSGVIMGVKS